MFLVKSEMMKVIGESKPCHSPFQKPATLPEGEGDFSTLLGPGKQLTKKKSQPKAKVIMSRFFIFLPRLS